MLSNEQRAHDLAIVMLQNMLQNPASIALQGFEVSEGNPLDVDKLYLELYNSSLSAINKIFSAQI